MFKGKTYAEQQAYVLRDAIVRNVLGYVVTVDELVKLFKDDATPMDHDIEVFCNKSDFERGIIFEQLKADFHE